MEDLEAAHLALLAASAADGGCQPCVQGCVDEAIHLHPELPWEDAVHMLRPPSTEVIMRKAVVSSRELLAEGRFPPREGQVSGTR